MTRSSKNSYLIVALLVGIGLMLAAAMMVEPLFFGNRLVTRAALFAGCFLATTAGIYLAIMYARQARKSLERYVDLLYRQDIHDITDEIPSQAIASLGEGDPWREVFNKVHQCVLSFGRRLEEAEHARASIDVRARRLASENDQASQILAGISDPVLAIDQYDEVIQTNESAKQLFNFDLEGAEHKAINGLIACEELIELLTETRRRKTPVHHSGEISLTDDEGQTHWYQVNCRDIATESDVDQDDQPSQRVPHGAMAVVSDISNLKAIQKRNAEFVSAVSHEMKTPLAGIKAYVELLADGDAEDEATREEFLNIIDGQADRLRRLVENLLNIARIEAGVVQVNKEARALNEMLEEAAGVIQPSAQSKPINLVCELSPMYLGVLADRDMLTQSAINLLSNAVKYTPPGGTVTLRSRMADDRVEFEVEDTGVGLSEEDRLKVFEKFYRVKKDSQMASGTGLGLPLAKHIVEDVHDGELTVESELGQGSTFRISLPCVREVVNA